MSLARQPHTCNVRHKLAASAARRAVGRGQRGWGAAAGAVCPSPCAKQRCLGTALAHPFKQCCCPNQRFSRLSAPTAPCPLTLPTRSPSPGWPGARVGRIRQCKPALSRKRGQRPAPLTHDLRQQRKKCSQVPGRAGRVRNRIIQLQSKLAHHHTLRMSLLRKRVETIGLKVLQPDSQSPTHLLSAPSAPAQQPWRLNPPQTAHLPAAGPPCGPACRPPSRPALNQRRPVQRWGSGRSGLQHGAAAKLYDRGQPHGCWLQFGHACRAMLDAWLAKPAPPGRP